MKKNIIELNPSETSFINGGMDDLSFASHFIAKRAAKMSNEEILFCVTALCEVALLADTEQYSNNEIIMQATSSVVILIMTNILLLIPKPIKQPKK